MDEFFLDPEDELPHPPADDPTFNESVYVNGFDPKAGFGGWMRLGNRLNEGHAELSVCFYLPDGTIACQFLRPPITDNARFSAGGLGFDVIEPFERIDVNYSGDVMLVRDPALLNNPQALFQSALRAQARIQWRNLADSPMHGGRPVRDDQQTMYGRDFSLNHFNQHTKVAGSVGIGDKTWNFDGSGWRDHSWGPRTWQAIYSYRLFLANFGDGRGLMLLKIADKTGRSRRVGVLMIDHEYEDILDLDVTTRWNGAQMPTGASVAVRTAHRTAAIEAQTLNVAPLRNRRTNGGTTLSSRIWESFTRFSWDGCEGLGMSEYIERLDDGRLAGDII
jgi:hypothetical protein